jgi:hypothetical protein
VVLITIGYIPALITNQPSSSNKNMNNTEFLMNIFKLLNRLLPISIAFALALTISSPGFSQTPDGETPANEGVCDSLQGGSPGLYGLCNAYCEAQDLDSFDKEPPRTKILANYRKKMKAGDPDMPCVQIACPCWSAEELGAISADGLAAACPRATNKVQLIDNAPRTLFAEADTNTGRERCRYIDLNAAPPTIRSFTISPEEAASCYAQASSACDELNL